MVIVKKFYEGGRSFVNTFRQNTRTVENIAVVRAASGAEDPNSSVPPRTEELRDKQRFGDFLQKD